MWKIIEQFPDYMVNEKGVVYDMNMKTIIKQRCGYKGYTIVCLKKCNLWHTCSVHRLVAEAFIPNPHRYAFVGFFDEKGNVSVDNLYWTNKYRNEEIAIEATDIATKEVMHFDSIKEATQHILNSKRAIYAGRLVKDNTINKNIQNSIKQPSLYPYMYGYEWLLSLDGGKDE